MNNKPKVVINPFLVMFTVLIAYLCLVAVLPQLNFESDGGMFGSMLMALITGVLALFVEAVYEDKGWR